MHDILCEIRRGIGLPVLREESAVADEHASDDGILARLDCDLAILADSQPHLREVVRAIGSSEELPCLGYPKLREAAVEAATNYPVQWVVRFEEEWFAGVEGSEMLRAVRSPKVDVLQIGLGGKISVPIAVGYTHVGPHTDECAPIDLRRRVLRSATMVPPVVSLTQSRV